MSISRRRILPPKRYFPTDFKGTMEEYIRKFEKLNNLKEVSHEINNRK